MPLPPLSAPFGVNSAATLMPHSRGRGLLSMSYAAAHLISGATASRKRRSCRYLQPKISAGRDFFSQLAPSLAASDRRSSPPLAPRLQIFAQRITLVSTKNRPVWGLIDKKEWRWPCNGQNKARRPFSCQGAIIVVIVTVVAVSRHTHQILN